MARPGGPAQRGTVSHPRASLQFKQPEKRQEFKCQRVRAENNPRQELGEGPGLRGESLGAAWCLRGVSNETHPYNLSAWSSGSGGRELCLTVSRGRVGVNTHILGMLPGPASVFY